MKKPKITVIVPYWNAEKFIGRCAESVKCQEGPFEFIFVNDHSTDNGYEVLKQVTEGDGRFVRITEASGDGHGVSWARNVGLELARGEWVTFLDADDELMPEAYEKFCRLIKTDADIHQENHIRHYVKKNVTRKMYENAPGVYELDNLPQAWFGVWNKLYRAELLKDIRFDESMRYGEDELFNLECLVKARRIHHGGDITVRHNIENVGSLSHIRKDVDLIRQVQKLGDFIIRHKDPELRRIAYDLMTVHLGSSWYWSAICGE